MTDQESRARRPTTTLSVAMYCAVTERPGVTVGDLSSGEVGETPREGETMTDNPINIDLGQIARILLHARRDVGSDPTFDWNGHTFEVSSNPDENVELRLDLTGSSNCVLAELGAARAKSVAYPADLPFVPGRPVMYGLIGDSLTAIWRIGPDRQKIDAIAPALPADPDSDQLKELSERYAQSLAEGGEQLETARAEIKTVLMERAEKIRNDPDLKRAHEDHWNRMKEVFGDGSEIKHVFRAIVEESERAGWIPGVSRGDEAGDFRQVSLERGDRTRTLFMQAPGPVAMVMLQDLPTSEIREGGGSCDTPTCPAQSDAPD